MKTSYENWIYTQNPFFGATRDSFEKLYVIVTDHSSKLKRRSYEPEIDALYQRFLPFKEAYTEAYTAWKAAFDIRVGKTAMLDELLGTLVAEKLMLWEALIRLEFAPTSAEYQVLFREGRAFFSKAKKDLRIEGVIRLAEKLKLYANLSAVQTDVEAFALLLSETRDEQLSLRDEVRYNSKLLHDLRESVCVELFRNFASLLVIYPREPRHVTNFFQMELIRTRTDRNALELRETEHPPSTEYTTENIVCGLMSDSFLVETPNVIVSENPTEEGDSDR